MVPSTPTRGSYPRQLNFGDNLTLHTSFLYSKISSIHRLHDNIAQHPYSFRLQARLNMVNIISKLTALCTLLVGSSGAFVPTSQGMAFFGRSLPGGVSSKSSVTSLSMNLFDRFSRVAKSNLNNILQKLEDPEKIMSQALEDMQASGQLYPIMFDVTYNTNILQARCYTIFFIP